MRLRLSLALASLALVACDTSTATDPSRVAPGVPSLAQDRLPAGTVIQVAFPTQQLAPGATFVVREPSGTVSCSNEALGIGPHYLTSIGYVSGGTDPDELRNVTDTFAAPALSRGTRFRITGLYERDGVTSYTCGWAFLYNAVVL